ncbi:MAG: PaaI family thioesterase [Eubacterium sp.]|nr:PaaI family thioesterase [Eubacterium sp.]
MRNAVFSQEEFEGSITRVLEASKKQPNRMNANLGLIFASCSLEPDIKAEYIYSVKELHKNPYDWVHGGIIAAVMDYAMGVAVVAYTGHLVATTDMSVSYTKAMKTDDFRVIAEFTHIGKNRVNGCVRIIEPNSNQICATAQLGFSLLKETAESILA